MKHLDLFSGIGGFAYAVDQVWSNAEHIFCDNDKFCQQVLKKHWPNSKIYGDIRQLTTYPSNARSKKVREREDQIFLLTGGFPCQPFSQAGKRQGTDDARYLWPEMLRVIRLTEPRWIIAENVRGLLTQQGGLVFEQVCLDLEASGYEVQPFIIPAVAVNAPHRRDRVWIVAHRNTRRIQRHERESIEEGSITCSSNYGNDSDTQCERHNGGSENVGTNREGLETDGKERELESRSADARCDKNGWSWEQNWLEVATELCGMDDGLSAKLDGFELSKSRHRVERLKSLGNAIVPQVAIEILKAINAG